MSGARPRLREGEYVFAVAPVGADLDPVVTVVEDEGRTVVLRRADAEAAGLSWEFPCAWITLEAPTLLQGTGLMARVAVALAERGIACNPVAGFHHDHLFVPYDRAADALAALAGIALPDGVLRE